MSDHIDGPRTIADPSIDMAGLYCYASPENPARTVLAADVFPSAARVNPAEFCLDDGRQHDAAALLAPVADSRDPDVSWRLADIAQMTGDADTASSHLAAARSGFKTLLGKHLFAFADHGAEFYAGSGDDSARAIDLAAVNLANRPTTRAIEQHSRVKPENHHA